MVEEDLTRLNAQWERIKAGEKRAGGKRDGLLDDIPRTLPALSRAGKVLERVIRKGGPQPDPGALQQTLVAHAERLATPETAADADRAEALFGDLLLAAVALGRAFGLDGEEALRSALNRHYGDRCEGASTAAETPAPESPTPGKQPPHEG